MVTFEDLGVSGILLDRLTHNGFTEPTEIQQKTIPLGLQHRDVIGSAQTGTGKTLAFLVPVLNNIVNSNNGIALIIEPTRELAQQIIRIANKVVTRGIFNVLLIGGESYDRQIRGLKRNPRIIIGTPGRIIDHIERKTLRLDSCHSLVLDETDRMFDMGFRIQLEKIFDELPEKRQTFMFSATFPKDIEQMAIQRLHDPAKVFVQPNENANKVADNLVQETVKLSENEKYGELTKQIEKRNGSIIVFVKTKLSTERLSSRLFRDGYSACAIHGDLRQRQRERIISMFRNGKYKILIGTDIIARGLDIPHVMHVINYDIPYVPEDYVHRIGRTARHGANGYAVSFVTPEDNKYWDDIQCMLDPSKKKQPQNRNSGNHSHHHSHHRLGHSRGRRPTNGAWWENDNRNSRNYYHRREEKVN